MRIICSILFTIVSGLLQASAPVQEFTLDNGLKILVKEDHRSPIAVSMIWYNIGSADEPAGITGISHILEHLMFKGTEQYPQGVFSKTIASLGGQENAFTNHDYTAYYEKIAARDLATSFKLEADRMQHLTLDPQEFSKEIKVIQEERRMRTDDNPQAVTLERFLATAHLSEPYHHPVIGWMNDIIHMNVGDAKKWYSKFYAPNNATLVVVGDVSAPEVYTLAKKYFGAIKKQPLITRKVPEEPARLGEKTVLVHSSAQVPMLMLGYTVPSIKTAPKQDQTVPYTLEIIGNILDSNGNGRFQKHLIRASQVASQVSVYYNGYARYQTQFILFGIPGKNHSITELNNAILNEIKQLQTTLIDEKELKRVKTQLIAQKTYDQDSIFETAMELGLLETIGLGWQTNDHYIEKINSITPKQLQKAAQQYFLDNNMTQAKLIPSTPLPR